MLKRDQPVANNLRPVPLCVRQLWQPATCITDTTLPLTSINHHSHRKHAHPTNWPGSSGDVTSDLAKRGRVSRWVSQSTCVGRMAVGGGLGRTRAEPRRDGGSCVPHRVSDRRQIFLRTSIIHLYTYNSIKK